MSGSDALFLAIDEAPATDDCQELSETLFRWNMATVKAGDCRPFAVWLRDAQGRTRGGVAGETRWDWAHIDTLWVDPELRGQGHGRALLQAAEDLARSRGCAIMDLDTFSFQAPSFYSAQGFVEYAVLEGISHGVKRHHFRKTLPSSP